MADYDGARVPIGILLGGYTEAVKRFSEAAAGRDAIAAFRPLFEALNWAVALDSAIGELWRPDGEHMKYAWRSRVRGAEAMSGVRFARNRVHHQWADALRLAEGRTYPKQYPTRYFAWVWRDVEELPKGSNSGHSTYVSLLQGHLAEATLRVLGEAFDHVGQLLEVNSARPTGLVWTTS
jgi:hypothetical protein